VIEKDAQTLNKVILANFAMLSDLVELIVLIPMLTFLSGKHPRPLEPWDPILGALQLSSMVVTWHGDTWQAS